MSNPVQQQKTTESEAFTTYPECIPSTSYTLRDDEEYKSNVQIIPSFSDNGNNSKVTMNDNNGNNKITKVKVANEDLAESSDSPKTIILSTGITNISITNDTCESSQKSSVSQVTVVPSNMKDTHYERVFLATSTAPSSEQNIQLTKSPLRNSNSQAITTIQSPEPSTSKPQISSPARCKHTGKAKQNQQHPKNLAQAGRENISPGNARPALTRGLTEAVITSRPSRIDQNRLNTRTVNNTKPTTVRNNNLERNIRSESLDQQRQRSSSTSEVPNRLPRQHRPSHVHESTTPCKLSSPQKRLTLREQQVNLLRREIMHPGGVRLQLRRKDCMGSVGWVDAFGAVW